MAICVHIYIYTYMYIYMDACTETLTHMLPPMHEPTFSFPESTWHKCCSIHHMLLFSMLMKALMSSLPGMSPMSGWAAVYWASNQLRQMAPISSDVVVGLQCMDDESTEPVPPGLPVCQPCHRHVSWRLRPRALRWRRMAARRWWRHAAGRRHAAGSWRRRWCGLRCRHHGLHQGLPSVAASLMPEWAQAATMPVGNTAPAMATSALTWMVHGFGMGWLNVAIYSALTCNGHSQYSTEDVHSPATCITCITVS